MYLQGVHIVATKLQDHDTKLLYTNIWTFLTTMYSIAYAAGRENISNLVKSSQFTLSFIYFLPDFETHFSAIN